MHNKCLGLSGSPKVTHTFQGDFYKTVTVFKWGSHLIHRWNLIVRVSVFLNSLNRTAVNSD